MLRFLLVFLLVQGIFFGLEMLQPVQTALILPWTSLLADVSGWYI